MNWRYLSRTLFFLVLCLAGGLGLNSAFALDSVKQFQAEETANLTTGHAGDAQRYALCQPRIRLPQSAGRVSPFNERFSSLLQTHDTNFLHPSFAIELDGAERERWRIATSLFHASIILKLEGAGYQKLKDTSDS